MSTFCLKCSVSHLSPPVSSIDLVMCNQKLAVVSSAATRASLSIFTAGLNHSMACPLNTSSMQGAKNKSVVLYERKIGDVLPLQKTFTGQPVIVQPCSALPVRRPSRIAIRSELPLPGRISKKYTVLLLLLWNALAAADVPAARIYYETYKLAMTIPLKKAYNQEKRQRFFTSRFLSLFKN